MQRSFSPLGSSCLFEHLLLSVHVPQTFYSYTVYIYILICSCFGIYHFGNYCLLWLPSCDNWNCAVKPSLATYIYVSNQVIPYTFFSVNLFSYLAHLGIKEFLAISCASFQSREKKKTQKASNQHSVKKDIEEESNESVKPQRVGTWQHSIMWI